jgi:spore coat protein U-like protein
MMAAARRRSFRLAAVAIGMVLLCAGRAGAACTISVSAGVAFGTYNVFAPNPLDADGRFTWRCSRNTYPSIQVTLTRGGSATFTPRTLSSGANRLSYNLYLDSGRTIVWGDVTAGTQAYYATYPGSGSLAVSIFGRAPAGQDVAVGPYTDTVAVVINF